MLSVLGLLTGLAGPIAELAGKILDLQKAKVDAKTDLEKEDIDQKIQEAHDRRAILVAEAGSRVGNAFKAVVRMSLAIGPIAVLLKLFLWDKVVGSLYGCVGKTANKVDCLTFNTDTLDVNMWYVIFGVIAFYFAYDISARIKQ